MNRNRGRRHGAAELLLLGALLLGLGGCDLFDTREPQDPIEGIPRHIPNDADSVLMNFEVAVAYKSAGSSQLSETLDGNYLLLLDGPDALRLGFDDLDRTTMENGMRDFLSLRVKRNAVRISFDRGAGVRRPIDSTHELYDDLPYLLEIYTRDGTVETVLERVVGRTDLTFVLQQNGNWAMQEWRDSGGDDPAETLGYYVGFYGGS